MPELSLEDVISATGGKLIAGGGDCVFRGISTDSRTVQRGTLFIPLRGEKYDGHDFIEQALESGAAGYLTEKGLAGGDDQRARSIPAIFVHDTLKALGDIAHFWRRKMPARVVAITGSCGKTTTKEMVASITSLSKRIIKAEGSFNNFVGLPLTILRLAEVHDVAILEMGTNKRGEIRRLTEIARPDIGVVTTIGIAHLQGLESIDVIREEKCDLYRYMDKKGTAVINNDDENIPRSGEENSWPEKRILFGMKTNADVKAEDIVYVENNRVRFTLIIEGKEHRITLSTVGMHNVYNALAAAAVSHALGIEFPLICRGLTEFRPVSGRMEVHRLTNGSFIIDDTYNANPVSVREALCTLRALKGRHRSIIIMGDMLELGDQEEALHEEIGGLMADTEVGTLYLRGRLSHATAAGAMKRGMSKDNIFFFDEPEEILAHVKDIMNKGDWILVKGSRKSKMEDVVRCIVDSFGIEEKRETQRG